MSDVFIMIKTADYRKVIEANNTQKIALNNYIQSGFSENIEYGTDNMECFNIDIFDFKKCGLTGEYLDVYNCIDSNGDKLLISCNYTKLSNLCGFLNRVIEYCE